MRISTGVALEAGARFPKIETARGTVMANAAIVTVPTPLIAAQGIRFRPELTDKAAAVSVLPLGLADKLVMAVEVPELLPMDGHLTGNSNITPTGSYNLRPFGRPLIEGFFGGRLAHDLEAAGPGAFFDFAAAELVELFGSGIRSRLRPLVETGWGRDPFARGSYSYALPGHAGARAALAAPVDGRVFFAGEACSPHNGARRLSDRNRSRRRSDQAKTLRDLTRDGVLAPPRVPGPFSRFKGFS